MLNLSYISILLFWSHHHLTRDHSLLRMMTRQENTMITFCTLKMYPLCSFMNRYIALKQHMNYQAIEK